MVLNKRKTISKIASTPRVTKASMEENVESDEEVDMQIVAVETKEVSERDMVASRTKELKSMSAADLKALLLSSGLETGSKEVMIKSLLKHEAKARTAAQEQKAKIRGVVVKKKQELESRSLAELGKLCEGMGMKGLKSKEERVQRLLVQWQENDGVDKALAQIEHEERKQELDSMDNSKLQKLCSKVGVDPFVQEIMVDRISKCELQAGAYSRPAVLQGLEAPKGEQVGDMVDTLLANEAQRKKDRELKNQQEDVAAKKKKELKSLSIEDLKKRLTKKGLEASGKKEEMIDSLFLAAMQEEAVLARKAELNSKSLQELKEMTSRQGLESGSKDSMVKTLLAHEASCGEKLKVFETKVGEVAALKKKELDTKTNAALKELCAAKGLPVGGDKEERIERLVEEVQKDRELDKDVTRLMRNTRKDELMRMAKPDVLQICEKMGVDPVVRDVMVERVLAQESEGETAIVMADAEPAAKRARVSKK